MNVCMCVCMYAYVILLAFVQYIDCAIAAKLGFGGSIYVHKHVNTCTGLERAK